MTRLQKIVTYTKKITLYGLAILTLFSFLAGLGVIFYVDKTLDKLPPIDAMYLDTYGSTRITDRDGQLIYQDLGTISEPVTYEELPELYVNGLLAIEDANFWTNPGFSPKAVLNAVIGTVRSKIDKSYETRGGSTIEQQLIKNTYYNGGRGYHTVTRKIHELFLAKQMDENFTKKDILTYYVNKLELGENTKGIKAAMLVYFNKSPEQYKDLSPENVAQLAYLVGLGQAPSSYNLFGETAQYGVSRKDLVLSIWKKQGLIDKSLYADAQNIDIVSTLAPRFHYQEARRQVNLTYKPYTDGVFWELSQLGYDLDKVSLTVKTHLSVDTYNMIKDVTRQQYYLDDQLQVGVTVMRKDGVVVGIVGGRTDEEYNRATQQTRSSGSSMKPFTAYGPLLQYFGHSYNTASTFDTSPYLYPGTNIYMYNYAQRQYGYLDMQQSLRWSLNTPVARIDDDILGSSRMKTFLSGLGLDVKDSYSANDGIGLNISTLQAAAAYNSLNNGGVYIRPRFVDIITFADGTSKTVEPFQKQAMNPSVTFVLTQMLRGVPQGGIGSAENAHIGHYDGYAGKTGSVAFAEGVNNNYLYGPGGSDTWYDSLTNNNYSVSVWLGYDTPNTSPQIPDNYKGAQLIGKQLHLALTGNDYIPNWVQPEGVVLLSGSGLKAHYGVTDASDTPTFNTYVPDLSQLPKVSDVKPTVEGDPDWFNKLSEKDRRSYELYQTDPNAFIDTGILSDDVYQRIKGG